MLKAANTETPVVKPELSVILPLVVVAAALVSNNRTLQEDLEQQEALASALHRVLHPASVPRLKLPALALVPPRVTPYSVPQSQQQRAYSDNNRLPLQLNQVRLALLAIPEALLVAREVLDSVPLRALVMLAAASLEVELLNKTRHRSEEVLEQGSEARLARPQPLRLRLAELPPPRHPLEEASNNNNNNNRLVQPLVEDSDRTRLKIKLNPHLVEVSGSPIHSSSNSLPLVFSAVELRIPAEAVCSVVPTLSSSRTPERHYLAVITNKLELVVDLLVVEINSRNKSLVVVSLDQPTMRTPELAPLADLVSNKTNNQEADYSVVQTSNSRSLVRLDLPALADFSDSRITLPRRALLAHLSTLEA